MNTILKNKFNLNHKYKNCRMGQKETRIIQPEFELSYKDLLHLKRYSFSVEKVSQARSLLEYLSDIKGGKRLRFNLNSAEPEQLEQFSNLIPENDSIV